MESNVFTITKVGHINLLTISLLTLSASSTYCQQGNNWYFGVRAGITFNTSPPSTLTDGAINTQEGCSTISDNKGQLLFYTDGYHVWNRQHQVMPNGAGLKGRPSASDAAIIVPRPGSSSIYYIFTADEGEEGNTQGYNFSEVDMNLDGGLGDITANKNILLFAPSSEQLTAVRHANGIDAWIVTKVWGNNEWRVYKVDCNGVNTSPIESYAGLPRDSAITTIQNGIPITQNWGSAGCLKPSPDGKMLAATSTSTGYWELFNFDNATGMITNPLNFPQAAPYGIEFSPDSRLLYVATEEIGYYQGEILQYNLVAYDSLSIVSSKVNIGTSPPFKWIGGLQAGPDNKIYFALESDTAIGAINNPNAIGLSCGFHNTQIGLQGWECQRALPVFFPALVTHSNADFSYSVSADCSTVSFSATSNVPGALNWSWDFGDGSTGTGQQVNHIYTAQGPSVDTVILTVSSPGRCGSAIAVKEVNLSRKVPVAHFGFVASCGNLSVLFTDSSTISGSNIQSWNWDFGDGVTSIQQNPVHTYAGYGNYPVKLSVTSSGVCNGADILTRAITVNSKPVAQPAYSGRLCEGNIISFKETSTVANGTITQWHWNFDDGTKSLLQTPQKSYASANTFKVGLTVVASSGCVSDTSYLTLPIGSNPVVSFSVTDTCFGELTQFRGMAAVSKGIVTNWWWDLGSQTLSSIKDPTIYYPNSGNFLVRMAAASNAGCLSDTISRWVSIGAKPLADFIATAGCVGNPLPITNWASIASGTIGADYWDFGDGNQSSLSTPFHTYEQYGNYTIKHNVMSIQGCQSDTTYRVVNVQSVPRVDFKFGNTCVGKKIQFINSSANDSGAIQKWNWDFGDGSSSNYYEPFHTFNQFGQFPITLTAITENGCRASADKLISITEVNVFAGHDTIVAINQPLQLVATGAKHYTWYPPIYLDDPESDHPIAILSSNMTYFLTGLTAEGCKGYDTIHITVFKSPDAYVPNAFTPNGDGHNDIVKPTLSGIVQLIYFSVYNRWGQLVFTTKTPGDGWNGKTNGSDDPTGVYVWMLKARDYTGRTIEKKGTVMLIR